MKLKMSVLICAAAVSACAFALPHGGPWRPGPAPMHVHHHGGHWGRGGRNFWPGFVGGVIGGAVIGAALSQPTVVVQQPAVVTQPVVVQQPTVVTQPVVVQQPVVQQQVVVQQPVTQVQNVWVEGRYVDQVQPNGAVVRVWSPGHYEQRTVVVQ